LLLQRDQQRLENELDVEMDLVRELTQVVELRDKALVQELVSLMPLLKGVKLHFSAGFLRLEVSLNGIR
jgi:hypothetical protein